MKSGYEEKIIRLLTVPPDILFRESYFNSAILLLLVLHNGEYHFVFEKRSSRIRQGSEICFPGGMFESDQDGSFQETALRETSEELGIPLDKLKSLGQLGILITPQGVLVEGFLGIGEISLDEIKTDPGEVEYVFSVPVSFFEEREPEKYYTQVTSSPVHINENGHEEVLFPTKELNLPEKYHSPWKGRKHNIYVYRYQEEVIWGITAAFIYNFIQKYKALLNGERI